MKYIYYILLIWIIASLAVFFAYHQPGRQGSDIALQINDRVFSSQELRDEYAARPYNVQNNEELLDRIITREILIQEALRQKIDLDESFRRSMKSYYEQSLTKVLLERQSAVLAVKTDPSQVKRFIELMDKDIAISLFKRGKTTVDKKLSGPFMGFSSDIQMTIILVPRGELTPEITVQGETYHLRLDAITNSNEASAAVFSDTQATAFIDEYKRDQALQEWLERLRRNAKIKINTQDKGKEGK